MVSVFFPPRVQLSILSRLHETAPELLEDILRQKLQQHACRECRLLLLVAPVRDVCEIEMDLANVFEADVARAEKRWHEVVFEASQIETDAVVQESHGDLVQLLRH